MNCDLSLACIIFLHKIVLIGYSKNGLIVQEIWGWYTINNYNICHNMKGFDFRTMCKWTTYNTTDQMIKTCYNKELHIE